MMIRNTLDIGHMIAVCCDMREDDWEQIVLLGGQRSIDDVAVQGYQLNGPKWAYTDIESKRTLLCGGFIPLRTGVYASWFLATNYAWENHARDLTLEAIDRKAYMFDGGAHRIETLCLSSRIEAHVWYKKVGSNFESTLKGYCIDGSDAAMFVETRRKH